MLSTYLDTHKNNNGYISIPIALFIDATERDKEVLRSIKYKLVN